MKLDNEIENWKILSIVTACAAPAIALNVWPRLETMYLHGITSNEVGIALLVAVSAMGMTCVPFAMKKAPNWGFWLVCLCTGAILAAFNYTMAVGAVGKARDKDVIAATTAQDNKRRLEERIRELKEARGAINLSRPTSEEMVESARQAVELAKQARDQECGKVGDHCRARQAQLHTRQSDLATTTADRAATERASSLDRSLQQLEQDLSRLGAVAPVSDPQAARIAAALSLFIELGNTEVVATGIIHAAAIVAELFALIMPRVVVTAIAGQGRPFPAGGQSPQPLLNAVRTANPAAEKRSLPAPPPTRRRSLAPPLGEVKRWRETQLLSKPGNRLKAWDAYIAYKSWCASQQLSPASNPAFEYEMDLLGVKAEKGKQVMYLDVEVVKGLKVVA